MFEFFKDHPNICIITLAALIICATIVNKFVVAKLPLNIKRSVQGIGAVAIIIGLGFSIYSIFF